MITLSLVVCGTVLFISAFLPFLLNRERKDEDRFYTPSRIILIPGFIYRIRSGARTTDYALPAVRRCAHCFQRHGPLPLLSCGRALPDHALGD